MTGIAWDGKTLAADNMSVTGNTKFRSLKAHVIDHYKLGRCLFALSGNEKASSRVKYLLEQGSEIKPGVAVYDLDPTCLYGMLIDSNKRVYDVYGDATIGPASHTLQKFATSGSAWEFLLGAMCAGACAERAIGLAEEHRTDVGFGCTALNWDEVFADYEDERPNNDIPF